MGFLGKILVGVGTIGLGTFLASKIAEYNRIEEERQNTPCYFSGKLTINDFYTIVRNHTKHIKRLTVFMDGPVVNGVVRSQSGRSTWCFKIDFNDFGEITGRYWLHNENQDSYIPQTIAELIKKDIEKRL